MPAGYSVADDGTAPPVTRSATPRPPERPPCHETRNRPDRSTPRAHDRDEGQADQPDRDQGHDRRDHRDRVRPVVEGARDGAADDRAGERGRADDQAKCEQGHGEPGERPDRSTDQRPDATGQRAANRFPAQDHTSCGTGPDDLTEHPGQGDQDQGFGDAGDDPDDQRAGQVARRGQFAVRREDEPDRRPDEGHRKGQVGQQAHGQDPQGLRPATWAVVGVEGRTALAGQRLVRGHQTHPFGLEDGRDPAAEEQPDHERDDDSPELDDDPGLDRIEGQGVDRGSRRGWRSRPASAGRRAAGPRRTMPPRRRKAPRASGQVAGRARVTSSAVRQRRPAAHGAGLDVGAGLPDDEPGLGTARPGARTWRRWSAASTSLISAP